MHTVFSREKTMAKQDILFGTTALFFTKVWDYKEIFPGKARWKTQTRVIYLAFKHL